MAVQYTAGMRLMHTLRGRAGGLVGGNAGTKGIIYRNFTQETPGARSG
jgi:hypothetical protein